MIPKVSLKRIKLPENVTEFKLRPIKVEHLIYRDRIFRPVPEPSNNLIKAEPVEQNLPVTKIQSSNLLGTKTSFNVLTKKSKKIAKKKKSKLPIISSVQSLHPKEIAKKLKRENPPPPPEDPTPETIDPNFEFIDVVTILCKTCNRLMPLSYYHYHIKTRFHLFFIKFPQFKNEKVSRQQRVSEGQIFNKMRLWCDVCKQVVIGSYYEMHSKNKTHLFYLENPDMRLDKQKRVHSRKFNKNEDVLSISESKVMICDYCRQGFRKKYVKLCKKTFNSI
jgi:hypothetical protein